MTVSGVSTALGEAAEAVVVALAMSGDRGAFSELVWRRQSWLRNLLRRLCHDPALADEVSLGKVDAPDFAVTGDDELSLLAQSLNRMKKSLSHAIKMLEE